MSPIFPLTFEQNPGNILFLLGDRIVAIRRVLAPLTEVRILVPQPNRLPRLRRGFNFLGSHRLAV